MGRRQGWRRRGPDQQGEFLVYRQVKIIQVLNEAHKAEIHLTGRDQHRGLWEYHIEEKVQLAFTFAKFAQDLGVQLLDARSLSFARCRQSVGDRSIVGIVRKLDVIIGHTIGGDVHDATRGRGKVGRAYHDISAQSYPLSCGGLPQALRDPPNIVGYLSHIGIGDDCGGYLYADLIVQVSKAKLYDTNFHPAVPGHNARIVERAGDATGHEAKVLGVHTARTVYDETKLYPHRRLCCTERRQDHRDD